MGGRRLVGGVERWIFCLSRQGFVGAAGVLESRGVRRRVNSNGRASIGSERLETYCAAVAFGPWSRARSWAFAMDPALLLARSPLSTNTTRRGHVSDSFVGFTELVQVLDGQRACPFILFL